MDDGTLTLIIVLTILGFCALAFLLLAPVYLFLKREQQAGEKWTRQILGTPAGKDAHTGNGSPQPDAADEEKKDG